MAPLEEAEHTPAVDDWSKGDQASDDDIQDRAQELADAVKSGFRTTRNNGQSGPGVSGPTLATEVKDDEIAEWEEVADDITERFWKMLSPKPRDFDSVIESLLTIKDKFPQGEDEHLRLIGSIDSAKTDMQHWSGEFADQLVSDYLIPLPIVIQNQGKMIDLLADQLIVMKRIYDTRREEARDIAKDALPAVKAAVKGSPDAKGIKIMLAALVVAGTFATPLITMSATMGAAMPSLLGGTLSSGAVAAGPFAPKEEESKPSELSGGTVQEVVDNVHAALDEIEERVAEDEFKLKAALRDCVQELTPLLKAGPDKTNAVKTRIPNVTGADNIRENLYMPK